jgi:putative DNA primase/helicase
LSDAGSGQGPGARANVVDFAPVSSVLGQLARENYPGIPDAEHLLAAMADQARPEHERRDASERLVQLGREKVMRDRARNGGAAALGDPDVYEESEAKGVDMGAPAPVRILDATTFLSMDLPPREPLILGADGSPIMRRKDNVLIYAPAGVGKTWTRDAWAVMLARAGSWVRGWPAPAPRRVLIVDGEMPGGMAQERLRKVIGDDPAPDPGYLRLLLNDLQERPIPSLGSIDGQEWIEPHLDGTEVLFLDHLSALFGSVVENDAEGWGFAQAWLLGLRRRGITVVLIHHAGRAGHQRGTSKREDIADLVLALKRPDDYEPEQGLRFVLNFQKARGVIGPSTEPFEVSLDVVDGVATFRSRDAEAESLDAVTEGLRAGKSIRAIATDTGIPKSTVQRLASRAKARGLA